MREYIKERKRQGGRENMKETIEKQREFFASGKTLDLKFRLEQLENFRQGILRWEGEILRALETARGRPSTASTRT